MLHSSGPGAKPALYGFGDFILDLGLGQLRLNNREVPLRPKTFELLVFLARNSDRLLSKAELMNVLWPDSHVTEDSLTQCIGEIRKALGDDQQQILKTVPRRGYIFRPKVHDVRIARPSPQPPG